MNINNIINLIKAYFYENWQKDLLYSFTVVATLAMFNMAFGLFNIQFVFIFFFDCHGTCYLCRIFVGIWHRLCEGS